MIAIIVTVLLTVGNHPLNAKMDGLSVRIVVPAVLKKKAKMVITEPLVEVLIPSQIYGLEPKRILTIPTSIFVPIVGNNYKLTIVKHIARIKIAQTIERKELLIADMGSYLDLVSTTKHRMKNR